MMRMAPLPTLAACIALFSPAVALAKPVPADHGCMGRWVGRGQNSGHSTSWTIDLNLMAAPSGGRCGTIEYTNPACGGTLESCRLVGDDIHTRERYTHNSGDCAPAGRVIIRCEGDRMRYSWIGWERVDSVLHRPAGTGAGPPSGGPTPAPTAPQGPADPAVPPAGQAYPPPEAPTGQPMVPPGDQPRPSPSDAERSSTFGCASAGAVSSPMAETGLLAAAFALWVLAWRRARVPTSQ